MGLKIKQIVEIKNKTSINQEIASEMYDEFFETIHCVFIPCMNTLLKHGTSIN